MGEAMLTSFRSVSRGSGVRVSTCSQPNDSARAPFFADDGFFASFSDLIHSSQGHMQLGVAARVLRRAGRAPTRTPAGHHAVALQMDVRRIRTDGFIIASDDGWS